MSEHVVVVVSVADDGVVVMFFLETSLDPSFSCGSPTTRRSWLLVSSSESSSQASRLKRGRRSGRESSEGGGEEEGREFESTSEQKEPDREVSPDELSCPGRLLVAADMLKYLLSCLTAPAMSACCCWGKFHVLSLLGLDGPPYIGSCLIGPVTFFSGTRSGLFCISSRAWMKWHRGP